MPHTLLLADDSVTIQRVIELTFADEDVRVVAVGDGQQAIDRIFQEPPDIVLADVGMPGCDGYEVAEFVKSRSDLKHIPVLLLTGAFEPVDEARVQQVRADGVLAKPFEPQELITRVKALLGAGTTRGAAGAVQASPAAGQESGESPVPASGEHEAPPVAGPGVGLTAAAGGGVSLDDYFDRLDAAFASLSVPSHIDDAASVPRPMPEIPWQGQEGASDAPSGTAPSRTPAEARADRGQQAPPAAAVGSLSPAEAFAAFLEAEQTGLPATGPGGRNRAFELPPAYPPVEELVETIARRVIAQLSDQVVRESVAETVSTVAERLVREEIERLKASIS
jgi:CheY-like chemotaxis protein